MSYVRDTLDSPASEGSALEPALVPEILGPAVGVSGTGHMHFAVVF